MKKSKLLKSGSKATAKSTGKPDRRGSDNKNTLENTSSLKLSKRTKNNT